MPAAVVAIGSVIGGVASAVASVVAPLAAAISAAIAPVAATISSIVGSVTAALGGAIGQVITTVTETVGPMIEALESGLSQLLGAIDAATKPILQPIADGLKLVHDKLEAVDAYVAEKLKVVEDVTKLIDYVATVKVITDLVKGNATIADLIGRIAEGAALETATAIAQLTKSIAQLGVGLVDRIDTQWKLLNAEFDSFDERIKRGLREGLDLTRAQVLGLVTPRITTLGDQQLALNAAIARLARHVEDEQWFAAMILRVLL